VAPLTAGPTVRTLPSNMDTRHPPASIAWRVRGSQSATVGANCGVTAGAFQLNRAPELRVGG
jgi:hypothetical protein